MHTPTYTQIKRYVCECMCVCYLLILQKQTQKNTQTCAVQVLQHHPWHVWRLQQNRPFLKAAIPPGEEAIKVFCRWQSSKICLCWGHECMEQNLTDPGCIFLFFFSDIQEAQRQKDSERWKCLKKTDKNTTQGTMYHPQSKRKFSKQRERLFFLFQWPGKQHAPRHHLSTTVDWQHNELNSRAHEIRSFLHRGLWKPPWTVLSQLTSIKMISVLKRRKH